MTRLEESSLDMLARRSRRNCLACVLLLSLASGQWHCAAAGEDPGCGAFNQDDPNPFRHRMIKGSDSYNGQFPFHVVVRVNWQCHTMRQFRCNGVIISRRVVLTTGRCIDAKVHDEQCHTLVSIFINGIGTTKWPLGFHAVALDYQVHERFLNAVLPTREVTTDNDIALIYTDRPFKYRIVRGASAVNRICLPKSAKYLLNEFAYLASYGSENPIDYIQSQYLKYGKVSAVSERRDCAGLNASSKRVVYHGQFCAVTSEAIPCIGPPGPGAAGDAGGALARLVNESRWELIGLFSYSLDVQSCGETDKKSVSVFTRVADYLNWIDKNKEQMKTRVEQGKARIPGDS